SPTPPPPRDRHNESAVGVEIPPAIVNAETAERAENADCGALDARGLRSRPRGWRERAQTSDASGRCGVVRLRPLVPAPPLRGAASSVSANPAVSAFPVATPHHHR